MIRKEKTPGFMSEVGAMGQKLGHLCKMLLCYITVFICLYPGSHWPEIILFLFRT